MTQLLEINNHTEKTAPEALLRSIEAAARAQIGYKGRIELTLLGNQEIRELNNKYRGKDYATDVLSWAFQETEVQFDHELFGEIYLSLDKVASQAQEKGHTNQYEIAYIFAHGLLHLAGYDHQNDADEAEMNRQTEQIVNAAGVNKLDADS